MNLTIEALFGAVVRRKREELNLSQAELARMVGYPQSNVSRLEQGQRSPGLGELMALAKAFNVLVGELLADLEHRTGAVKKSKEADWMVGEPAVPYSAVPVLHEALTNEDAALAQLASYGVRFLGKPVQPAVFKFGPEDALLAALRFAHEPRLFEALPSFVLRNSAGMDWGKLVAGAFALQLQNRLGMVVSAALQLKKFAPHVQQDDWRALEQVYRRLAEARLDREEVLGPKPRTAEALEHLAKRTPTWLRAWHALGAVDIESLGRHLSR